MLKLTGNKITIVKVLAAPDGELAPNQGSVQDLADGYLVDFGAANSIVEYNADGTVRNDMHFQKGVQSYRVFKYIWHATPLTLPSLAVTTSGGTSTAYVSWNGATEVASWRLVNAATPSNLITIATVTKTGFESSLPAPTAGTLAVQALDASGRVIGTSSSVTVG